MAKDEDEEKDYARELLEGMVAERGERSEMGEHWDAARKAIGEARWFCDTRDVSPEIAEMRSHLALSGKSLEDIGTSEAEIAGLLASNKGNRNPAKSAKTYAKSVARLLKEGNLRSAKTSLTMLDRYLADAGLDLAAVGVTQARYDAWCAKLRPPKKEAKKRPRR